MELQHLLCQPPSSQNDTSLTIRTVKQPTAGAAGPASSDPSPGEGPVLIVDSEPAVRRVLRLMLEGAGVPCIACSDIDDAAKLVSTHSPRFILADVRLDGGGGQELADRLASAPGWRPPIALMSAYPRPRKGLEDYFLPKPIEFDGLLNLLERAQRESPR